MTDWTGIDWSDRTWTWIVTIFIFLGGKDAALSQDNLIYKSIT